MNDIALRVINTIALRKLKEAKGIAADEVVIVHSVKATGTPVAVYRLEELLLSADVPDELEVTTQNLDDLWAELEATGPRA